MKKTQFLQANGLKALRSRTNVQASTPRQIENKKHLQSQASTGKGILRKNQIDFSQNSIIVRGLSWVSGEKEVRNYFGKYGDIKQLHMPFDNQIGMNKGFCFIRFGDERALDGLYAQISSHYIDEKKLQVFPFEADRAFVPKPHVAEQKEMVPTKPPPILKSTPKEEKKRQGSQESNKARNISPSTHLTQPKETFRIATQNESNSRTRTPYAYALQRLPAPKATFTKYSSPPPNVRNSRPSSPFRLPPISMSHTPISSI